MELALWIPLFRRPHLEAGSEQLLGDTLDPL